MDLAPTWLNSQDRPNRAHKDQGFTLNIGKLKLVRAWIGYSSLFEDYPVLIRLVKISILTLNEHEC